MKYLKRMLLAVLCMTSCEGEEDPEVCSTEHAVDDFESAPVSQKALGSADDEITSQAASSRPPVKAGAPEPR